MIRAPAVTGPTILSPKAGETVARTGMLTMPKASGLKPGAGWIILYRSLVTAPTGTGFKSASVINEYGATGVEVQWL